MTKLNLGRMVMEAAVAAAEVFRVLLPELMVEMVFLLFVYLRQSQ